MLQNAEDAGASEVRFVLDPSSYSREKIMTPIAGKNDLGRMQVNKSTSLLGSLWDLVKHTYHLFSSKLPLWIARKSFDKFKICYTPIILFGLDSRVICVILFLLYYCPGWCTLCVQRCQVHWWRLGWNPKCWVQSEEGEGGQGREIWHWLQFGLPLNG